MEPVVELEMLFNLTSHSVRYCNETIYVTRSVCKLNLLWRQHCPVFVCCISEWVLCETRRRFGTISFEVCYSVRH